MPPASNSDRLASNSDRLASNSARLTSNSARLASNSARLASNLRDPPGRGRPLGLPPSGDARRAERADESQVRAALRAVLVRDGVQDVLHGRDALVHARPEGAVAIDDGGRGWGRGAGAAAGIVLNPQPLRT
eukprot:353885-Chlamydomonas_euryale.AAC.2